MWKSTSRLINVVMMKKKERKIFNWLCVAIYLSHSPLSNAIRKQKINKKNDKNFSIYHLNQWFYKLGFFCCLNLTVIRLLSSRLTNVMCCTLYYFRFRLIIMPVPRSKKPDTKLYDLLEVSPDATTAQIAKVK